MASPDTRAAIMARTVDVLRAAEGRDEDPLAAAERAFPGIPETVVVDALTELDRQTAEAWWRSIEGGEITLPA